MKHFEKQSVDYDDTEFLQKMFSQHDNDVRNLAKAGTHQSSMNNLHLED